MAGKALLAERARLVALALPVQLDRGLRLAARKQPVECDAQIRLLGQDEHVATVSLAAFDALDGQVGRLREREEEVGVRAPQRVFLSRRAQALERELADRLEHP